VAVEDAANDNNTSSFGVTAKGTYKTDSFGIDVSGGWWGEPVSGLTSAWALNAGVGATFSPLTLSAAIGIGNPGTYYGFGSGNDYTRASAYAKFALSEAASVELGFVHDFSTAYTTDYAGASLYEAGVYYSPVNKLTLGVEGEYVSGGYYDGSSLASFVTVFKF
jgi:hypothetical protein